MGAIYCTHSNSANHTKTLLWLPPFSLSQSLPCDDDYCNTIFTYQLSLNITSSGVMDYESRLISRPLLHNYSALLAFSVLLQTTLPPRGYRDNLNAAHRRSEVVVRSFVTRATRSCLSFVTTIYIALALQYLTLLSKNEHLS